MAGKSSMKSSRLKKVRSNGRSRLISLAVLVGLCASFFPLPLSWHSATEKDLSAPFPCQDRPCGCKSAEQCWKQCCCFTNSQKLAWAKANHVAAPSYVSVAAAKEQPKSSCNAAGCCSRHGHSEESTGCEHCSETKSHLCRQSSSDCDSVPREPADTAIDQSRTTVVLGVFWHKCQGHSWFWNSLPWGIVVDHCEFTACANYVGEFIGQLTSGRPQLSLQPPVPPPRDSTRVNHHS